MRRAIPIGLALAILAWAPAITRADWHIGRHGVYHAGPHHWWTNDGHHGHLALTASGEQRAIHAHHREGGLYRGRPDLRRKCDALHVLYLARHGIGTPDELHGETGCFKWSSDAIYHDERRSPVLPTARGMLFGAVE